MRPKSFVRDLPVPMTATEKLLKSDRRTALTQEVMDIEENLKAHSDEVKTQIKAKEKELLELHRELRTGEEIRPIQCVEVFRFDQGMVEIVRDDTGEVVERRAMDPRDRQAHMDLGDFEGAREKRRSRTEKPAKGKLTLLEGETEEKLEPEETH